MINGFVLMCVFMCVGKRNLATVNLFFFSVTEEALAFRVNEVIND